MDARVLNTSRRKRSKRSRTVAKAKKRSHTSRSYPTAERRRSARKNKPARSRRNRSIKKSPKKGAGKYKRTCGKNSIIAVFVSDDKAKNITYIRRLK